MSIEKTENMFKAWMRQVDKRLELLYGLGHSDLADFLWHDCFEDELTPSQAVGEFCESEYSPENF